MQYLTSSLNTCFSLDCFSLTVLRNHHTQLNTNFAKWKRLSYYSICRWYLHFLKMKWSIFLRPKTAAATSRTTPTTPTTPTPAISPGDRPEPGTAKDRPSLVWVNLTVCLCHIHCIYSLDTFTGPMYRCQRLIYLLTYRDYFIL